MVTDEKSRNRILTTVESTNRFVFFSCVAMGLVQMMALTLSMAQQAQRARCLRTRTPGKVSEATILSNLTKKIYRLMLFRPDSGRSRIIRQDQRDETSDSTDKEVVYMGLLYSFSWFRNNICNICFCRVPQRTGSCAYERRARTFQYSEKF